MKLRSTQKEESAPVMMAPLIDCVFILLVFFLVTSLLQKPHNELLLDVPHEGVADEEAPADVLKPFVITLSTSDPLEKRGRDDPPRREPFILLDDLVVSREVLESRLREVAGQNRSRPIRIISPGQIPWRHVVPIIDLCRFHGLTRITVN